MAQALPFIAMGLQVAGAIQESRQEDANLKALAQAEERNSEISSRNQKITEQQTEANVEAADRQRRLRLGANIAAMGASGISGGSGLDILDDNLTQETLDILNIRREGVLASQNYQIRSDTQLATARNYRAQRPSMATTIMKGASAGISSGYKTGVF